LERIGLEPKRCRQARPRKLTTARQNISTAKRKAMMKISEGLPDVHKIPADLRKALTSDHAALAKWEGITPLARNEWICWITFVKKDETRREHVQRTISELKEGMRRPCCWIGCIHRTDKSISPSVQGVLNKRNKKG